MTVRVNSLAGTEAGAYYVVEAAGSYYLDPDEPPGRWFGEQADALGLSGEIDADAFMALMDGRHPDTGAQLGRRYGDTSVRGLDITFNAPKSVSVLRGIAEADVRAQIEAAHDAAVDGVLGFLERHAHARVMIDGERFVFDAGGLVVGAFRQHTSRALDPHLHTHAVVIGKVRVTGCGWYALDALMPMGDQRTLSALYHAGLRAELTRRLGVRWRTPEHGIAELADVPEEVCALFSQRTAQVDERYNAKVTRFRQSMGRDPNAAERYRLKREAVTDSRPAKRSTRDLDLTGDWRDELAAAGVDPDALVADVTGNQRVAHELGADDLKRMTLHSLVALADDRSSWRRGDVVREVARATPTTTPANAEQIVQNSEALAEEAIAGFMTELKATADPDVPQRRDGRPVTEGYRDRRLTLPDILREEAWLVGWAERRWARAGHRLELRVDGLDRAQRAVASAIAGTAPLVIAVGPAGAGKTTALRPAYDALRQHRRPVFGLAPSATAAGVITAETGIPADTIDKLLHEHTRPDRPPAPRFNLPYGATVVVDEAGMVATPKLAQLARLADQHQWRIVLIGDPYQLAAVGRGGMFTLLAETGPTVELETVHRFRHRWERAASLQLRQGNPDVINTYYRHGRLDAGPRSEMEHNALDQWLRARTLGRTTLLLTTTIDGADRLNTLAQAARLDRGELDSVRWLRWPNGRRCYVGDEIVTRRNDRTLRTDRGIMIKNRAAWTVTAIYDDASLSVHGPDGTVRLPVKYVTGHAELGYAQTTHAAQGRTVDEAILIADHHLDSRGLYVGLTRGRHANYGYIITPGDGRSGNDILEHAIRRDWADEPATRTQREFNLDHALDIADRLDRVGRNTRLAAGIEAALNNAFGDPQHTHSLDDDFGIEL
jgi:conjugative relaxase-like TrwC/TraI family protein